MMSSCWQVTFRPAAPDNETLENFLEQYFEVTACNYDDDGNDEYVGYQSGTFDEKAMVEAAHAAAINLPPYEVTFLESSNWLKDYVIKFAPFETEDFMFYGIHETSCPQTSLIPVQIYAATAFGSDHQTTRSCIKALSRLYHQGFSADNILDVGTGSGILAIAALKLGAAEAEGVDIDPMCVRTAGENAERNGVAEHFTVLVGDLSDKASGKYNIITANIVAAAILSLAPHVPVLMAPGARFIASGIIDTRKDEVLAGLRAAGLEPVEIKEKRGWVCVICKNAAEV